MLDDNCGSGKSESEAVEDGVAGNERLYLRRGKRIL